MNKSKESIAKTHSRKGQAGSTILELLWTLPLFISLVLFIVFAMNISNVKGALSISLSEGARLGVTRGDFLTAPDGMLSAVTDLKQGTISQVAVKLFLSPELRSGDPATDAAAVRSFLQNSVDRWGFVEFSDLPEEALYSLIYTLQFMRQQLGPLVRYPCDPSLAEGAGCLLCAVGPPPPPVLSQFVSEQSQDKLIIPLGTTTTTVSSNVKVRQRAQMDGENSLMRKYFSLHCTYRGSNALVDTLIGVASACGITVPLRWTNFEKYLLVETGAYIYR